MYPRGLALLQECLQPLLALCAGAQAGNRPGGIAARLVVIHAANAQRQLFTGTHRLGRAGQQLVERVLHSVIKLLRWHNGLHEAECMCAGGAETLAGDKQRPRVRLADLAYNVGRDHGGAIPSLTSLKAKRALSAAIAISHTAINPTPPPIAVPLTRATTGQGQLLIVSSRSARRSASSRFCSSVKVIASFIALMSAPALKEGPSPVSTMACSRSSAPSSVNAVIRSCRTTALKA